MGCPDARAASELPQWVERSWDDVPVEIELASHGELEALLALLGRDDIHREALHPHGAGLRVQLRLPQAGLDALLAAGWRVSRTQDTDREGREQAEREGLARLALGKRTEFTFPLATYPSSVELGQILQDLAALRPDIAQTYQWGTSVDGRPLWGLLVSDNPGVAEAEPEVRLAAGIHGDETVDTILLLNLAHELVSQYGQPGSGDLTELVDAYELHFMPQINPDGYTRGSRYNTNFYDLNRNFPEPAGQQSSRQPETLQFMTHALDHNFVISQTGHGGALVVNYPWDYTYTRAPDDAAIIALSLEYSTQNLPMYNGAFTQGITNGADWYVITGSLQDWSYAATGCIDLTLEVSNTKWPLASTLPGYWNDNRQSLINFVRSARYGVNGVVTAAHDGSPLDAVITVAGIPEPVFTDPEVGDYYKLLPSGTFDLGFEAAGYEPVTITGVSTEWGTPTVLDVALQAIGTSAPTTARPVSRIDAVAPNPFNPATEIRFHLGQDGPVSLTVIDARGRELRTLLQSERNAGEHAVRWDGRDDHGRALSSGVYFVVLHAVDGRRTAKAVLVE